MPIITKYEDEAASMLDRDWTAYYCSCGTIWYSDIPYQQISCLDCGTSLTPRQVANLPEET